MLAYLELFVHEKNSESRQDNDIARLSKALELEASVEELCPTEVPSKDFDVIEPHGSGARERPLHQRLGLGGARPGP